MKMRIRKTGEIVDVISCSNCNLNRNKRDWVSYIDSSGVKHLVEHGLNILWDFEDMEEKPITEINLEWQRFDFLSSDDFGEKKKYRFTGETITIADVTLYRIQAMRDFGNVRKGEKGGFIQSEKNLSHEGSCWVYDNAKVYGDAEVYENALVYENAEVCGAAWVYGNAIICGNAKVCEKAKVYTNAIVYTNARVCGYAKVCGNAEVFEYAMVYGDAWVYGNAMVHGDAWVCGNAEICGNVEIKSSRDYIVFKNFWSSGRYFTYTRPNGMYTVGCFYGTGEELIKKAYADSQEKGWQYERVVRYVEDVERHEKEKGGLNNDSTRID